MRLDIWSCFRASVKATSADCVAEPDHPAICCRLQRPELCTGDAFIIVRAHPGVGVTWGGQEEGR
eukprot:4385724-Alexandrium_andersonii.AAC.1